MGLLASLDPHRMPVQHAPELSEELPSRPLETALFILIVVCIFVAGVVGTLLTLLTLPGLWLTLLVALLVQLLYEPLFSWYTLGACVAIGLAAEIYELIASSVGAKRSGGGASGAWGALAGSILGAIAGSFLIPIPIVGTIAGAVIGAGSGAFLGERGISRQTWRHSLRVGTGAAKGRFMATIIKSAAAGVIALTLCIAVLVR